tara:strand:- start:2005 stop:3051 length:1047 start_codon:yes stop_codon:yes gene_type:complete
MSACVLHTTELDPLSLQFLRTGKCDPGYNTGASAQDQDLYDPFIDGCHACHASQAYVIEDISAGQVVCTNCGLALRQSILQDGIVNYANDQGVFTDKSTHHVSRDESNPFDQGHLAMYPKGYMQEFIGRDGKKRTYDMSRLNVRYISHKQKDFWQVGNQLKDACDKLGSRAALEYAKKHWGIISKSDKVCRGANRRGLIGNCLLFACHRIRSGRSQDEIGEALSIPSTEITKGRKIFIEIMVSTGNESIINTSTHEETQFSKLAGRIGVPKTHWILVRRSEEMYDNYKHELSTLAPQSGIAGVLYYNIVKSGLKVTKGQIKDTCQVCTPTLNKSLKIIEKVIARDSCA